MGEKNINEHSLHSSFYQMHFYNAGLRAFHTKNYNENYNDNIVSVRTDEW